MSLWSRLVWSTTSSTRSCPGTCARTSARPSVASSTAPDLQRPRPSANDRARRSGAREPFSTRPCLTVVSAPWLSTNHERSRVRVAGDKHSLTDGPNGPTLLQDAYVVQHDRVLDQRRRTSARARGRRPWPRRGSTRGVRHGLDTGRKQLARRRRDVRTRALRPRLSPARSSGRYLVPYLSRQSREDADVVPKED